MVNVGRMVALLSVSVALVVFASTSLAQATVTLTVPDNQAAEAGQDPAQFTVTRTTDAGTGSSLRVYLQLGGTAVRNIDYATTNLNLSSGATFYVTIPAAQTSVTVTTTPHLDNLIEGDESITLDVLPWQLAGNEYVIGAPSDGQATIADDVAEVHLTVGDDEAAEEGQDPAGFTVTRDGHGDMTVSLRIYVQLGGTAMRPPDYTATNLNFAGGTTYYATIPANQASISVTFTPTTDNLIEGEETITYSLLGPLLAGHDYTIGAPNSGGATISDDVAEVHLTVDDIEAAESGQDSAGFTVTRDSHGDMTVTLRVYVQLGGTAVRVSDYTTNLNFVGGTTYYVTIPANQASISVIFTPATDNLIEGEETITYSLLGPLLAGHDYTIGAPNSGGATISDDVAEVHLTVDDIEAAESGQDSAGFTVTRDSHGEMTAALRVYVQVGGTAVRTSDYSIINLNFAGGTTYYVTIPANQASISVIFTPATDNLIEGEETITYSLLGPLLAGHDYTIGAPNSGGATLSDDVAVVTVTASDPGAAELGQDTGAFTVSRSNQGDTIASLRVYLQLGGSAARITDYTTTGLNFAGGSTYYTTIGGNQLSQAILITPVFELIEEGDETVTLTVLEPLLEGHDYLIGAPSAAVITIEDLVDGIFEDSFEDLEP